MDNGQRSWQRAAGLRLLLLGDDGCATLEEIRRGIVTAGVSWRSLTAGRTRTARVVAFSAWLGAAPILWE